MGGIVTCVELVGMVVCGMFATICEELAGGLLGGWIVRLWFGCSEGGMLLLELVSPKVRDGILLVTSWICVMLNVGVNIAPYWESNKKYWFRLDARTVLISFMVLGSCWASTKYLGITSCTNPLMLGLWLGISGDGASKPLGPYMFGSSLLISWNRFAFVFIMLGFGCILFLTWDLIFTGIWEILRPFIWVRFLGWMNEVDMTKKYNYLSLGFFIWSRFG